MAISIHNKVVCGPEEMPIPAHLSYGQFLFDKFKTGGDQIAQICGETGNSVTYRTILQKSVNLAVALQELGLKKGDVVSLSSENRFEFTVASLAVIYCGGTLSTLNVTYSPEEIIHIFHITKPKFIISSLITAQNVYDCSKDLPYVKKIILFGDYDIVPGLLYNELIKKHVDIDSFTLVDVNGVDDIVAVMCSSGTTGLPKGVMLTHLNFLTLSSHMKYYLDTSQQRKKHKVINALSLIPWFHAYGFISKLAIMCLNIQVVFLVRFEEKQFLETIENYKINMTTIVPPLAVFLAKHPLVDQYDLKSLNEVWCGAAPLSREIQNAVSKRTGISHIRQGYGLTEVTMACCVDLTNGEKVGSCGTPAPGMKIKVLDTETGQRLGPKREGELWIKSPLRMKGYMGDLQASAALIDGEGYVQTGDVGYYDEDGFFYIVDRLKELIKYKGFQTKRGTELDHSKMYGAWSRDVLTREAICSQVAPAELEALLLRHPGVADCGVVGLPDEVAGELPVAFVVPQPNANLTADAIIKYVASKVSPAKHLRGGVIFVEEIPKNPSGKILRRELKKLLIKVKSKI